MKIIEKYGILASMAWNSNDWAAPLNETDKKKANFANVKDFGDEAESINFGHKLYPAEADGYYIGYSPALKKVAVSVEPPQVKIVVLTSLDYHHQNRRCIVGLYGFPEIGDFERKAKHKLFKTYDGGNIRAAVADIIYFQNPVVLTEGIIAEKKLLPLGKGLASRGFNYLDSDNAFNILQEAFNLNPTNSELKKLIKKYPADIEIVSSELIAGELADVLANQDAGSLAGIAALEQKMQKLRPQLKERVVAFVERGSYAQRIKKATGYKCQLCEAMGLNPIGFVKSDGTPYVETHHVDPVANLATGALGAANIITLCANHHRQMHHGNARLLNETKTHFKFEVDGNPFTIKKIAIK